MKKIILLLIYTITSVIGFSQTTPTLQKVLSAGNDGGNKQIKNIAQGTGSKDVLVIPASTYTGTASSNDTIIIKKFSDGLFYKISAASLISGGSSLVASPPLTITSGTISISPGTSGQVLTSNGTSTPIWQTPSSASVTVTDDNTTNVNMYPSWFSGSSGSQAPKVSSQKLLWNPFASNLYIDGSLQVISTITSPIHIGGATPTSSLIFRTTTVTGTTGADIIFQGGTSGTTEFMRMLNSGNIGVNKNSPTEKLDVNGNIRFSGALMPNNDPGSVGQILTSNGTGASPTWQSISSGGVNSIIAGTNISTSGTSTVTISTIPNPTFITSVTTPTVIGGSGTTQSLIFKTTTGVGTSGADFIFQTGNNGANEAARILNNGNMGVGVSPTAKFHVRNSFGGQISLFDGSSSATGLGSGAYITLANTDNTTGNMALWGFADASDGSYNASMECKFTNRSLHYGDLMLATRAADGYKARLYVLSNGNIGIGTTSPTQPLDVIGNIKSSGSIILPSSSSGTTTISTPSVVTTYTFFTPPNAGSTGQFLQTNGSGVTSWQTLDSVLSFTIGAPGVSGVNYNFSSVANANKQSIQLGTNIVPAYIPVSVLVTRCSASLVGGTANCDIGVSSGTNEYISSASIYSNGDIRSVSNQVSASSTTSSIYFSITPSANWNTLSAGKWVVTVYFPKGVTINPSSLSSSYSLTIASTTTVTGSSNNYSTQAYTSSSSTAWTMVYSGIADGSQFVLDYKKTTASNLTITFPTGTIISAHSDVSNITSPTCTLVSTVNGRYRIQINRINSDYFATIFQDIQ